MEFTPEDVELVQFKNKQVSAQCNKIITKFAQKVSDMYDIPLDKLLKIAYDGTDVEATDERCIALKIDKTRCTRHVQLDGYCEMHYKKLKIVEKKKPVVMEQVSHTHPMTVFFLNGCPACEKYS
jgi:ethanolamine utilization protein EutA (predicted chaperonin)